MKSIVLLITACLFSGFLIAQTAGPNIYTPNKKKKIQEVETACGQCQFGLAGKGCNLAIKTNGKAYFVEGTSIDQHGDAHAADGFCNATRKAAVQGKVVDNKFVLTYYKLLPVKSEK